MASCVALQYMNSTVLQYSVSNSLIYYLRLSKTIEQSTQPYVLAPNAQPVLGPNPTNRKTQKCEIGARVDDARRRLINTVLIALAAAAELTESIPEAVKSGAVLNCGRLPLHDVIHSRTNG